MKQKHLRWLSLLLCACMMVGMLPAAVLAVPETQAQERLPADSVQEPTEEPTKSEAISLSDRLGSPEPESVQLQQASGTPAYELHTTMEEVMLDSYDQYLARHYLVRSTLEFYMDSDGLPYRKFISNPEETFQGSLETWRIVTMDVGDLATYSTKEVNFYVLLIYDVIYQKLHQDSVVQELSTAADAMMASTLAELAEEAAEGAVELTPDVDIFEDNWEAVLNQLCAAETMKDVAEYSGILVDGVKFAGSLNDLFDRLYMMQQFIDCSEEITRIMDDLYNATTDDLLKDTCRQMKLIASDLLTDAQIAVIFGGEVAVEESVSLALDSLWKSVCAANPFAASINIGKEIGKLASNVFFGTDKIVELWYSMDKVHTFEKALKKCLNTYISRYESNPTLENAKLVNKAADMFLNTCSVGMEYAIAYAQALYSGGLLSWLYNHIGSSEYEGILGSLQSIKNNLDEDITFLNNNTYNLYLEEVEANTPIVVVWKEIPTTVTEADVQDNQQENEKYLFQLTDQTTSEDTIYTDDALTYADYYHTDGTLDLAGKTLTVHGNFYLEGGTVNVNGGVLEVKGDLCVEGALSLEGGTVYVGGDLKHIGNKITIGKGTLDIDGSYIMAKETTDSAGQTTWTNGYGRLSMEYAEDRVNVGRDFFMYSSSGYNCIFTAGVLSVGGDFTQYFSNNSYYSFKSKDSHKVVLNGTGPQHVKLECSNSTFAALEIANPSEITVSGYFSASSLTSTVGTVHMVSDGMQLSALTLNTPLVEITGDLPKSRSGVLNLAGNTLRINGNLHHSVGEIAISKGTLDITGGYYMAKATSNTAGEAAWTNGSGYLTMEYAEDRVYVGGDFYMYSSTGTSNDLKAGILSVEGDFSQILDSSSAYTFKAKDSHKVILCGTGPQRVTMEHASSTFAALEITNPSEITVSGYLSADSLTSTVGTVHILSDGANLPALTLGTPLVEITGDVTKSSSGVWNLAGNTLRISGSLYHSQGKIIPAKGMLDVSGDYYMAKKNTDSAGETAWTGGGGCLTMEYEEDRIQVGGDYYMHSTSGNDNTLTAGVLSVAGDFSQIGNSSSSYRFRSEGTHKVVLSGTDAQHIFLDYSASTFGCLEIANPAQITLGGYFSAASLTSTVGTVYMVSDGVKLCTLKLDTPKVEIAGVVTKTGTGVLNLAGNTLKILGDLHHSEGEILIAKGTLDISGGYYLARATTNSAGEAAWTNGSGYLTMEYDDDLIRVGSDFYMHSTGSINSSLTAGKLSVCGDFSQIGNSTSSYRFHSEGTHKVVLSGDAAQRIFLDYSGSAFGCLEIANPAQITLGGYFTAASLTSTVGTVHMVSDGVQLRTLQLDTPMVEIAGDVVKSGSGILNLAGNHLLIDGSLEQSAGTIQLNKGRLTVLGDYRIQTAATNSAGEQIWNSSSGYLQMIYPDDQVIVAGDFHTCSTKSHTGYLTAGTLYVCGDFTQATGSVNNFMPSGTHAVVLCGTQPQMVTFASVNSQFNTLRLTQDISRYTFNPDPCWKTLEENVPIPDEVKCLNGHSWDDGTVQTEPDCLTEGMMCYVCTVCGETSMSPIRALGHSYVTSVTEPGCEFQGYTTHTCSRCGDSYVDSYTMPVGHSYDQGRQTTAPTCEEAGVVTYTCTVCADTRREAVEALGHDYAANTIPAGCLEQGYTMHTCSRCGNSYSDSYTDALGHLWDDGVVTAEPTEQLEGERTYTCSRCAVTRTEPIPALGSPEHTHDYSAAVTVPTCTEQGYTTYTCACGDSYRADYVDALGHSWNSGTVISYPSCDLDGAAVYTCSVCGTEKTQRIAAYGHDYVYEEIDPSCTAYGYMLYTCAECGYSYRAELVDPLWHYYVDGMCRRCDATEHEVLASGVCGDSLNWALTAEPGSWNATVTISGTGPMWNFDGYDTDAIPPWRNLGLDVEITTVRIGEGCTGIGDYAFDYWTSDEIFLETVILADSITKIGKNAFSGHDGLETLRLPEGLKTIGEEAFSGTGLLDVIIPDSVTYVYPGAFANCDDLVRAVLPGTLTAIADDMFYNCQALTEAAIPGSVTKIGADAFYGTELYRLTLPDSVTRIGNRAFYDCNSLEGEIEIGKNVVSIGAGAFGSCANLDSIRVDSMNLYYSSDDRGVLYSKSKGSLLQVPGDTHGVFGIPVGVTNIGAYAFAGSRIRQLEITDGIVKIGADAFRNCTSLSSVTIPASVSSIGSFAFGSCIMLKEVTFCGDAPIFEINEWGTDHTFYEVTATVWYPGNNETWANAVTNQYGGTLTWMPMKETEQIASGWSGYTQWTLTSDGTITFSGEGTMKNYTYKSEMPWYAYADQITDVVIEEGVTSIGSYAFYGMGIESIEIASTVTYIGDYAFKNAPKLDHVVLPENLTSLGDSAFYACTSLTAIEIPASLWTIKPYTFKNCTALTEVIINEGNLQKISDGAFYNTALTELVLPDCLDILDVYSFKNCLKLESITIGTGLTELREAVFYGTAIPTIEIPEGITKIGSYAFKNCVELEHIELPESLTSVGEASFYACTALKEVAFPDAVTGIGNYAFRKCAALEELTFGSKLTTIGECAFYGCTGLTEIVIPDKVTTIKPYAFKTCEGLTGVVLGERIKTIGEGAFNTCTGLKTIDFPASVTTIGDYCFSGSHNIWKLTFRGDAPAIGTGAFKGMNATAYYPSGNTTWTSAVRQNYGGSITWKAQ